MPGSLPVQSVFRALEILELVAKNVDGMTLDEIASRTGLNKTTAHNLALLAHLDRLATLRLIGVYVPPQRPATALTEGAVHGRFDDADATFSEPRDLRERLCQNTAADHRWQVDLSIASARVALGLEPGPAAEAHTADDRAYVRRAFATLARQRPVAGQA